MPTITEKTVREIALEEPSSIRVFESLGIDYCCGGKRPLSEACSRANVDLDRVTLLLDSARRDANSGDRGEWDRKTLRELIEHIVDNHHGFVRRETPRLEAMLTKVVNKHGAGHPELARIQELFLAISQELSTHMLKEEQILFPYVERMEQSVLAGEHVPHAFFGTVQAPIANMVAEHDDAGAVLAQIRNLTSEYTAPAGACPTFLGLYRGLLDFERDLHHHVHLENNILFPRAVAMESGR